MTVPPLMAARSAGRALLAVTLLVALARGETSWIDGLRPGPHAVGFRSTIELDHGRRYRTAFDDGATYGGTEKAPRPVLVNVWYPAAADGDALPPMPYREYFDIGSDDPDVDRWARALAAHAADVSCTEMLGKAVAELDELESSLWQRFLDLETACRVDAPALPGPFPFLVYHSGAGSSYEDNSVFCEYLASHGFVVVGSAYAQADGRGFGIDSEDGSVRDMEFLTGYAHELSQVDWRHGAFGGHSAGAQVSMRAMLRPDCPADALLLLDTTVDYYSLAIPNFAYLTKPALEDTDAFVRPMLVAAGNEASFQLCDRMSRADRTYLTFPELGHNEFIAQGVLRLRVRSWLQAQRPGEESARAAARAPEVDRLYVGLCEASRQFLDAELRGERGTFDVLCAQLALNALGGPSPCVERAAPGATGPPPYDRDSSRPPTPRQLQPLLTTAGVEGFIAVMEAHRDAEPRSPIYSSGMIMGSVLYDLAADDRLDEARALNEYLSGIDDLRPMGTLRFLAFMSTLGRRTEQARHLLEVALSIDPDDPRTLEELEKLAADD